MNIRAVDQGAAEVEYHVLYVFMSSLTSALLLLSSGETAKTRHLFAGGFVTVTVPTTNAQLRPQTIRKSDL
jgi:hypothetical protein